MKTKLLHLCATVVFLLACTLTAPLPSAAVRLPPVYVYRYEPPPTIRLGHVYSRMYRVPAAVLEERGRLWVVEEK